MTRRSGSARLIGRDRELADLLAAIGSIDPDRPVVLIGGEAGIGKTRLIGEVVDRLAAAPTLGQATWNVSRGSCLRLADGEMPYAPILEILDGIRDAGLTDQANGIRARLAGGQTGASVDSVEARTARFVEIHDALLAAAAERRLLVVIDDLHWADRSTLDLLVFLARRLRGGRVVLLLAYRSDELHRRHPLRPILAELTRGYVRDRVDLEPLDREAVIQQIADISESLVPDQAAAIAQRAEGNPFYVEELLALDSGDAPLPESVRDVVLARVASLDPGTVRVLGASAVVGREVDADLLAEAVGLDPVAVDAALRVAVDQSVLVPIADRAAFRFRHALLEEAVYDDLLPGDRVDLHRRVAAALQRRAASSGGRRVAPGEIARHLDLGGDARAAIGPYLEAASLAFRAYAWAEGIAAYERATELAAGQNSTDPETAASLRALTVPAALALNWTGAAPRAAALLRTWIERTAKEGDATQTARFWLVLGKILNDLGDELASRAAVQEAARLVEPDDGTAIGVELLIDQVADAWLAARLREALIVATKLVPAAERLGDPVLLFRSLVNRAEARILLGHVDEGLADVARARELERIHGFLDNFGNLPTNIGLSLTDTGFLDRALEAWQDGLRVSRDLDLRRSWDPWNLPGLAYHAILTGRWRDADEPIAAARGYGAQGMPTYFNEIATAFLAAGRGDVATADSAIELAEAGVAGFPGDFAGFFGLARAARADAASDPIGRVQAAEDGLAALEGLDAFVVTSRLAVEIASGAADIVELLHPTRDGARIADARERAQRAVDLADRVDSGEFLPGSRSVPWTRANKALAAAEAARAEGRDDPATWQPIAAAFEAMDMGPRVAYIRYRMAAALLGAGERTAAQAALSAAHALASSIGMTVLDRRIAALARAARLDLEEGGAQQRPEITPEPGDAWGLSAREREVLALVADGRTNGEIGERLFISAKTASVHVTHILDKLGVSTRTEAAILASQAGILG